jgi:seryl-tRNA synthetase
MLQVHNIRDKKDEMIAALAKRSLDATQLLEDVLKADEERRSIQAKLDETLAQSNTFSKEIGQLFKNGETQKANLLKEKTTQLKEISKDLNEKLNAASENLKQLLFTLPNIPNSIVPAGTDESDN